MTWKAIRSSAKEDYLFKDHAFRLDEQDNQSICDMRERRNFDVGKGCFADRYVQV